MSNLVTALNVAKEVIDVAKDAKEVIEDIRENKTSTQEEDEDAMDVEPVVQEQHRFHAVPWPVDTTGRSAPLKAAIRGLGNIKSEKVQKIIERVFDLGKATFIARCEVNRANQRAKDAARDKAIKERNIQNAQNTVASQEKALADAIAVAKAAKERLDATKAAAAGAE